MTTTIITSMRMTMMMLMHHSTVRRFSLPDEPKREAPPAGGYRPCALLAGCKITDAAHLNVETPANETMGRQQPRWHGRAPSGLRCSAWRPGSPSPPPLQAGGVRHPLPVPKLCHPRPRACSLAAFERSSATRERPPWATPEFKASAVACVPSSIPRDRPTIGMSRPSIQAV